MIKQRLTIFALILCTLSHPAFATWGLQGELFGAYDFVDGFAQTPMGGSFGSTSNKRPSFEELDFDHDAFYGAGLGGYFQNYHLNLTYHKLSPSHQGALKEPLISHNQFIPSQQPFAFNIRYRWYDLALMRTFDTEYGQWGPYIALDWLQYRYQFSAPFKGSLRGFNITTVNLGLHWQRYLTEHLKTELDIAHSIPAFNLNLFKVSGRMAYTFYQSPKASTVMGFLELGHFVIDMEDNQPIANHIHYTAKPYLKAGVQVHYKG